MSDLQFLVLAVVVTVVFVVVAWPRCPRESPPWWRRPPS